MWREENYARRCREVSHVVLLTPDGQEEAFPNAQAVNDDALRGPLELAQASVTPHRP